MPLLLARSPVVAGDDGKRTGDDGGDGRSGPAMTEVIGHDGSDRP